MLPSIVKEPNPILHRKAVDVTKITEEIQQFIDTMIETMYVAHGVGLAANQIGSNRNILVTSEHQERGQEVVLINPAIVQRSGKARSQEGCLSVPGVSSEITRAAQVTVTGLNREGKLVTLKAKGLLAKILQHEVDHLQGHLYWDRLRFFERRRLCEQYKSLSQSLDQIDLNL